MPDKIWMAHKEANQVTHVLAVNRPHMEALGWKEYASEESARRALARSASTGGDDAGNDSDQEA